MDINGAFGGLIEKIISVLPSSPFRPFLNQIGSLPYLGIFNWFFPVGDCLRVLGIWVVAIAAFYLYSVIARWVKLISD